MLSIQINLNMKHLMFLLEVSSTLVLHPFQCWSSPLIGVRLWLELVKCFELLLLIMEIAFVLTRNEPLIEDVMRPTECQLMPGTSRLYEAFL